MITGACVLFALLFAFASIVVYNGPETTSSPVWRQLLLCAAFLVVVGFIIPFTGFVSNYSRPDIVGTLVLVEERGVFVTTLEASITTFVSVSRGGEIAGRTTGITFKNRALFEKARTLVGKTVRVRGHQYLQRPVLYAESRIIVESIEVQ